MPQDTLMAPTIQPSGTTWAQFKSGGVGILLSNLAADQPGQSQPHRTGDSCRERDDWPASGRYIRLSIFVRGSLPAKRSPAANRPSSR